MKMRYKPVIIYIIAIVSVGFSVATSAESVEQVNGPEALVALVEKPISFSQSNSTQAEKSGREIMDIVYSQSRKHKAQEFDMKMVILNKDNKKRERHFTLAKLHASDETKSLINFYKPANIKGAKLLTYSHNQTDTRQWMFIPAFKSIKQILASEKNSSFMGSDFSYSDIAGRQIDQDSHRLVKEDDKYLYISSKPVDADDVYTKMNVIVDRKYYVIAKVDFYREGEIYKKLINKKISKYGNMYMATESIMYNLATNGKSVIEINHLTVDAEIQSSDLEIKSLY